MLLFTFLIVFSAIIDSTVAQLAAHGRRLGLNIGTAINSGLAYSNAKYGALIKDNANMVVAENDCKFHLIRTSSGDFDFSNCDRARGFAKDNGMKFRGHTLVWYHDLAMPWLGGDTSRMRDEIVNHITTVLNHYKGDPDFRYWDVVNEALQDTDGDKTQYRQCGVFSAVPDYVDLAFITARKADPSIRLIYNDYSTHVANWGHSKNQLTMVKDMLARGVPIDGVGFQAHVNMDGRTAYTADSVKQAFAPFVELGLEIHITELDVNCPRRNCDKAKQADIFKAFLQACVETPACTAFIMWGLTDAVYFDQGADALLFDANMQAKPAYDAMNSYLSGLQSIPPRKFGNSNTVAGLRAPAAATTTVPKYETQAASGDYSTDTPTASVSAGTPQASQTASCSTVVAHPTPTPKHKHRNKRCKHKKRKSQ